MRFIYKIQTYNISVLYIYCWFVYIYIQKMLLYHTLFYILTYLLNCIYILYEIKFLSLFIQKN